MDLHLILVQSTPIMIIIQHHYFRSKFQKRESEASKEDECPSEEHEDEGVEDGVRGWKEVQQVSVVSLYTERLGPRGDKGDG